mgnify:CR=1 FL=1
MDHSGLEAEETKAIKNENTSASRSGLLNTDMNWPREHVILVIDMGFGWGLASGRELRAEITDNGIRGAWCSNMSEQ